jgi:hypothetical protein
MQFCLFNQYYMMHRLIHAVLVAILLCVSSTIFAQSVNYKITVDDADMHPKLALYLQYGHLELNTANLAGSSSNIGLWGYYELQRDKLQIDFNIQKAWWIFGSAANWNNPGRVQSPTNHEASVGVNYFFKSSVVRKEKIRKSLYVITSSGRTGSITFKSSRQVKLNLTGGVKRLIGYRGGLYFKNDLYRYRSFDRAYVNQFNIGAYAGMQTTNIRNLVIDIANNGLRSHAFGQSFYADVLILPYNPYYSIDKRYTTEQIKNAITEKMLPLGCRIGYRYFQSAPKSVSGKKYGLGINGEMGLRPYHGFYISGGVAIALSR